ncbi:Putative effector of murein hydrolase LrgA, UPF0299 family [Ectothiorhodospira magna]|uniref:Putative effector of murein hydrolase LrgA, UPF0299 family n=1 Tax=Ectothiorhodospira magna TaxID=867345 RepID=A0A1H9E7Y9_9GAMM|nr:CidA/LrgA family protein [Ectothiorhodospira magna]SEQ21779.1 Putative effector of murein hydrolase LrgA, UPF0299 family [Ectothiorhodospira magna]
MLQAIILILLCQLAGEITVLLLNLPVPGPVLGMLLLFGGLLWYGQMPPALKHFSDTLLRHLALLFVPAGVGLMAHFSLVARDWLPLLAALVISTALALVVTMLVLAALIRAQDRP